MLLIQSLTHNHYMYSLGVIGGQSRAILTSAIFNKSVRVLGKGQLSDKHVTHEDVGDKDPKAAHEDSRTSLVIGFLSFECARIAQTASALHVLWTLPLSLATALSLCEFWNTSRPRKQC